ncbi:MAG TPA: hypothetical protein VMV27_14860 [Candidatus Binataceae bacterium]|nr:hypothetical protein [Candidatus Binataceae bacterium]
MRRLALILGLISIAACGLAKHDAAVIRTDNAAMTAASKKILISGGGDVPGHPKISTLGPVQGYCEKNPQGDTQAIPGDSMRLAAYRKYGDQVNAITGSHGWFVPTGDETSAVSEPGDKQGYWECAGTAVSFGAAPAPKQ